MQKLGNTDVKIECIQDVVNVLGVGEIECKNYESVTVDLDYLKRAVRILECINPFLYVQIRVKKGRPVVMGFPQKNNKIHGVVLAPISDKRYIKNRR